jgi:hypothetical protein
VLSPVERKTSRRILTSGSAPPSPRPLKAVDATTTRRLGGSAGWLAWRRQSNLRKTHVTLLRTSEAARLLNASPSTLRHWVEQFDFPTTEVAIDRRRRFKAPQVLALRDALATELSLPAAIAAARRATEAAGSRGAQRAAQIPPSTGMIAPVVYAPARDAR